MNSAAYATKPHNAEPIPSSRSTDNAHDDPTCPEGRRAVITVIAGGLEQQRRRPLHARARQVQPAPGARPLTLASLHRGVQGVPFELTRHERALASCFGTLLAAISLAVAIL